MEEGEGERGEKDSVERCDGAHNGVEKVCVRER